MEMFEKAVRMKLRFAYKGIASVEDLWDLSLTDLDNLFKMLNKEVKDSKEESLLNTKSEADTLAELKVEIVKYIVSVKLTEKQLKEDRRARADLKQTYLSIAAEKGKAELRNLSKEELLKMADALD